MAYLGLETIRRGNSAACIQDIFQLHFPDVKSVVDVTYGKGRFWDWNHTLNITGCDIDPQSPATIQADYRQLPFETNSFDVLVFDPPFIFTTGINRIIGTKRFFTGAEATVAAERVASNSPLTKPKNPTDLIEHTRRVIEHAKEIARVGLVIKGQDLIVNKADWWSYNTMKAAEELGIGLPTDRLIQHSPAHRMRDPRWKNQHHFRRADCIYLIWRWK